MTELVAPVRRQMVVPVDPGRSFEIFTGEIGSWWPLEGHSVNGAGGTVAFENGRLVETSPAGATSVWGEILEWIPGELLRLSWFAGSTPDHATEVRVHFAPIDTAEGGPATLVTLEHRGWERTTEPQRVRAEYESGWPGVFSRFGAATTSGPGDEKTWLVLRHTAGTAAPAHGPIFAHPDFAEHAAFLRRLAEAGVLVAAGPLAIGEQPGAFGMTVIKVPADEVQEYLRQASTADLSVVRGLLDVDPVTWNVVMS